MTLTEFLLARIAEDEHRAAQFRSDWVEAGCTEDELLDDFGTYPSHEYTEIGLGLGRWLAECEAKRRIVELADWLDNYAADAAVPPVLSDRPSRLTLRLLALPYADHPDYDEAWRS